MDTSYQLILASFSIISALALFYCLASLYDDVPEDDREFMDPLPKVLKLVWPLVRLIAYHLVSPIAPYDYVKHVEERLQKTGVSYLMMAEEFIALRIFTALFTLLFGSLILITFNEWNNLLILILPVIGYLYPHIWVRDIRKRLEDGILRTLPAYLDFISMAVEAGLNFSGAIEQARRKGPKGPLVNEFGIVLRDLRSGINRENALKRMAERLDIHELTSFVNAVVQAEKMGSGLGTILKIQAEQRRNERFQRAEKKAMEAPVKLVGPLILFIFPTTFIVLAFPIVMKFLHGGLF